MAGYKYWLFLFITALSDKSVINIPDENFDKQKNSINMFSKMKKVFSENLFAFYNPICFLDKLDKAGLFEFNPYLILNTLKTSYDSYYKNQKQPRIYAL